MRLLIALALLLASSGMVLAGPDDFEVEASNSAPNPVGRQFAKGDRIALIEGKEVLLRDRTGGGKGELRKCHGPYDGKIESCPATKPAGLDSHDGRAAGVGGTRGGVR